MRNKKVDNCMLYPYEKCNYCGYCEAYGLLDIEYQDEPYEEEKIEQLINESERKSDLM